jgi:hypothetical protein
MMIDPYCDSFALDVDCAAGGSTVGIDGVVAESCRFFVLGRGGGSATMESEASFFPRVGTGDRVGELGETGATFPCCCGKDYV